MTAAHLEVLVEEPSMEAFLGALLPRLLPADRSFLLHPFQGKTDLLGKLQDRLRGYAGWLPDDWRVVVVVDRDDDDCVVAGQAAYRHPDAILGGTWEAFERVLQRHGYFRGGLGKIEAARALGGVVEPSRNRSPSFARFRDALLEAVGAT